jgi:competence protein ComFC
MLINLFLDILFPKDLDIVEIETTNIHTFLSQRHTTPTISNKKCFAFLPYQNEKIKKAIFEIKYRKNKILARKFAEVIYRNINPLDTNPLLYTLIPIPANKNRIRTYGYNQTLLIAKALYDINPNKFVICDILKYKNSRSEQKHKNRKERIENSSNIFTIKNPQKILNKNVIIIDDIITTGATCLNAIETIKKLGIDYVIGIALVH